MPGPASKPSRNPGRRSRAEIGRQGRAMIFLTSKTRIAVSVTLLLGLGLLGSAFAAKPRVIVLTDIGGDPDDEQSMVRLLVYANQLDIEGLIATTSTWKRSLSPDRITERVNAYAQVRPSLLRHDPGYPTAEHLGSLVKSGQPGYGMASVGDGKSTDGSRLIVD
ncbi:MAG: DUF1593 domain-containing protein, partial [Acidobacteria bacterium]